MWLADQLEVAGRAPERVQRDQVERRRVRGAVIGGVRDQPERGQLAAAQLVHDLARLGITVIVARLGLPAGQHLERAARELRVQDHRLQAGDQRVAPEQRHEPRQPGGGQVVHVAIALDRQAQRRHVLDRLVEQQAERMHAGLDSQHLAPPRGQFATLLAVGVEPAFRRGRVGLIAVDQVVEQRAAPGLARRQLQRAAQPAVRIHDRHRRDRAQPDRAEERAVAIAGDQLPALFRPGRADPPAPDDASALDLEDVGEVAADRDFKVEVHALAAVIGHLDQLVHAAVDHPAQHEAQRSRRHLPGLAGECAVGQEHPRAVIHRRPAVQQVPLLAVRIERVGADDARVEEVEPLVGRPGSSARPAPSPGRCNPRGWRAAVARP